MRQLFFILLFATSAQAASVVKYVDTSASCGVGDGSLGSPYCSCAEWESSEQTNLVSAGDSHTVYLKGTDLGRCEIDGWTTGASNTLTLDGNYEYTIGSDDLYDARIRIVSDYVTVRRFVAFQDGDGNGEEIRVIHNSAGCNVTIEKNVLYHGPGITHGGGNGLLETSAGGCSGGLVRIRNNVIFGSIDAGIFHAGDSGENVDIEHNTIYGSTNAGVETENFNTFSGTENIYNNLSVGNGTDFVLALTATTGGNVSSDTSSPETGGRSKTISFVSTSLPNFYVDTGETDVIDQGSASAAATDDLYGVTRGGSPDVGAYEIVAADRTVFIRSGCTHNGTGDSDACASVPGGAGGYSTFAYFAELERLRRYDNDTLTIKIAMDGSTALSIPGDVDFEEWDSNLDFLWEPATGHEHAGVYSATKATLAPAGNGFRLKHPGDWTFSGLQFYQGGSYSFFPQAGASGVLTFDRLIVNRQSNSTFYRHASHSRINIRNSLFYDSGNEWNAKIRISSATSDIFHNTFIDGNYAIECAFGCSNVDISNNIFQNTSGPSGCAIDGHASSPPNGDYNFTEDSCTGIDVLPGANSQNSTTITFTNEGADDYTINDVSACVDNSLYSDPTLPVIDDFEGDARASSGEVYAGWDEDVANACGSGAVDDSILLLHGLGVL